MAEPSREELHRKKMAEPSLVGASLETWPSLALRELHVDQQTNGVDDAKYYHGGGYHWVVVIIEVAVIIEVVDIMEVADMEAAVTKLINRLMGLMMPSIIMASVFTDPLITEVAAAMEAAITEVAEVDTEAAVTRKRELINIMGAI
ncbi:hypothetical protein RHMOL_Rhmol03G0049300 [Rhododendron molle]|uniref:Uncharacterized protein n=1 Tax=Rhododendron molle TaxID=49168 RepID=A0ACC0PBV5_RHOML|nr:hypothetical protein RHMOL_Rhmol03G0049300 [Rhododendron molle]